MTCRWGPFDRVTPALNHQMPYQIQTVPARGLGAHQQSTAVYLIDIVATVAQSSARQCLRSAAALTADCVKPHSSAGVASGLPGRTSGIAYRRNFTV